LIELIIVIAILGVLATLVIPRVIGVKEGAETTASDTNKIIIENALERYYAKEGEYPEELKKLEEDGYIKQVPDDLAKSYKRTDKDKYEWQ